MTPTLKRRKKERQIRFTCIPGVSRCSPPMAGGDIECAELSTGGRRLHLCGDGVLGVPGSGLHLLRLGDWGLRRASNSIDRFNVAPQAMLAKQNGTNQVGEKRPSKLGFNADSLSVPRISFSPFFLSTTTDFLLWVVSQLPTLPAEFLKRHNGSAYHCRIEGGSNIFTTSILYLSRCDWLFYIYPVFNAENNL